MSSSTGPTSKPDDELSDASTEDDEYVKQIARDVTVEALLEKSRLRLEEEFEIYKQTKLPTMGSGNSKYFTSYGGKNPSARSTTDFCEEEPESLPRDDLLLQICFLIDATAVNSKEFNVKTFLTELQIEELLLIPDLKIEIAVVCYRDLGAKPQPPLNFTNDPDLLAKYIQRLVFAQGDDTAENVFEGFEIMTNGTLSWKNCAQLVFHVADAPCHGKEFHNLENNPTEDAYYNDDRFTVAKAAEYFRRLEHIEQYYFFYFNNKTEKMESVFMKLFSRMIVMEAKDVYFDTLKTIIEEMYN